MSQVYRLCSSGHHADYQCVQVDQKVKTHAGCELHHGGGKGGVNHLFFRPSCFYPNLIGISPQNWERDFRIVNKTFIFSVFTSLPTLSGALSHNISIYMRNNFR